MEWGRAASRPAGAAEYGAVDRRVGEDQCGRGASRHAGGRCESPSVGRGVLCAPDAGKESGVVVGLWLSFHRRASGCFSSLGKREAGCGVPESLARRPRPRDRCAKYDEGGSPTVSVGCVSGGGDSSTRGESSHWRLAGEKRRESSRQSPNEGSRVPAKRALNSAVVRGGTRPRPAVPRLSCICYSTQVTWLILPVAYACLKD